MNDVHNADERRCTEHRRRGALQHFDPLHVVQIETGNGGVERPTPGNIVDDQQERIEFVQAPKRWYGAGRAGVATRWRLDTRNQRKRRAQIGCRTRPHFVAEHQRNVRRHITDQLWNAGRGHLNRFDLRRARCRRLSAEPSIVMLATAVANVRITGGARRSERRSREIAPSWPASREHGSGLRK